MSLLEEGGEQQSGGDEITRVRAASHSPDNDTVGAVTRRRLTSISSRPEDLTEEGKFAQGRPKSWGSPLSLSTGRVSNIEFTGIPGVVEAKNHGVDDPLADEDPVEIAHPREIRSWYLYDFSNGAFFFSALNFLPLLAVAQAGRAHPDGCVRDEEHYTPGFNPATNGTTLYGFGAHFDEVTTCSDLARPFGFDVNYKSVPLYYTSLSVFMQLVCFLLVGGLADFGAGRKKMLVAIHTAASLLTMCTIFVADFSLYWMTGLILSFANVGFGICIIFYNAYLPLLCTSHHEVVAATEAGLEGEELANLLDKVSHSMSLRGFATGFGGQCLVLLLNFAVFLGMEDQYLATRVNIMIAGLWCLVFGLLSFRHLGTRPGPPLPPQYTYLNFGVKRGLETFKTYKRLPELFKFFAAYFLFSDGSSTLATAAAIFATQELGMENRDVLVALLEVSVIAILGCFLFLFINKKLGVKPKNIIIINLAIFSFIPLYGYVALTNPWEYYLVAGIFGLVTGSLQAFTRSLFSEMIPEGREAEYFSLFELTDRGTAWLGPLTIAVVNDVTGSFRAAFFAIIAFFVVGGFLFLFVDPKKGAAQAKQFAKEDKEAAAAKGTAPLKSPVDSGDIELEVIEGNGAGEAKSP